MAHGDSPAVTVTFTNKLWHTAAGSPRNSTTSQCPWYIPSTCTVLWEKTQHSPSQGGTPTPCAPLPEHDPRAPQHPSLPQLCHGGIQWCPKHPLALQDPMAPWDPCFPLQDLTRRTSVSKLLSFLLLFPLSNPHTGAVLGRLPSVHQHKHLCGQCQLQQQSRVVWEPMLRTAAVVSLPCCWAAARALGHEEEAFNMQALSYLMPFSRERW